MSGDSQSGHACNAQDQNRRSSPSAAYHSVLHAFSVGRVESHVHPWFGDLGSRRDVLRRIGEAPEAE